MRIRIQIVLFTLLAIFALWQCAYYNYLFNAKKEYEQGIRFLQKNPGKKQNPQARQAFEKTIEKCWKLIEIYSDKSKYADDALLYIIKSEFHLNKLAQAELHARQFISKYADSELIPEAYLWYGKILVKQGNIKEGTDYLYKAINSASKNFIKAYGYYELGYIAFQNEDYEKALELFQKALKEKIQSEYKAFLQFYLGESYYQQGMYKEAIKRFKKVEKFSPSIDIEYKTKFHMARSYMELGKYKEAHKILRKMLTAPRFKNFVPLIKTEIAHIFEKQGKLDEAVLRYKEVVRERVSNPGTALAAFRLGRLYETQLSDVDSAVYYYGMVKKSYAQFDSVEQAEYRKNFLSKLKEIKDAIRQDSKLVYRLEHDSFFRDSLYKAQLEDSIRRELEKLQGINPDSSDTTLKRLDSLQALSHQDSLKKTMLDSLQKAREDSLKKVQGKGEPSQGQTEEEFRRQMLGEESAQSQNKQNTSGSKKKQEKEKIKKKKPLERRKLPQIKQDLMKNKYHLAEFFLLETENYDSARVNYEKFLATYQDSILTPKALYSLYYIYSQPEFADSVKRDSLERILIEQYPESPFTQQILKQKGMVQDTASLDSLEEVGHRLFVEAEKRMDNGDIEGALDLYQQVAEMDSNLIWAAKAQLARAWIYEHVLNDIPRAIQEYTYLAEHYPQPEFVALAKKKIAPPETGAAADTMLAAADTTMKDTSTVAQLDTAVVAHGIVGLPDLSHSERYRQWRMRRARSVNR